jgi:hypothetical protein
MHQKPIDNDLSKFSTPVQHSRRTHKGVKAWAVRQRYTSFVPRTERTYGGVTMQTVRMPNGRLKTMPYHREAQTCPECPRRFMTSDGLDGHYRRYHIGELS